MKKPANINITYQVPWKHLVKKMRLVITGGKVDKRQRTHPNEEVLEKRSIESFDLANIDYKTLDSFKKRTIGIPIVKLLLLIH